MLILVAAHVTSHKVKQKLPVFIGYSGFGFIAAFIYRRVSRPSPLDLHKKTCSSVYIVI